jgi:YbbR domain-containing protein
LKLDSLITFLASLAIAIVLWLVVQPTYEENKEREVQVKLELRNLAADMAVIQQPESVTVTASGTTSDLDRLDSDEITAFIDFGGAVEGTAEYTVLITDLPASNLEFKVNRPRLSLVTEKISTGTRSVVVEESGVPPEVFVYDGSTVFPGDVQVHGPDSYLAMVDKVRVLFDISQIQPNKSYVLEVELLDAAGRPVPLVEAEPASVTVSPAVMAAPQQARVLVRQVLDGQPAIGYEVVRLAVEPTQLLLTGSSRAIGGLGTAIDTEPVSIEGLKTTKQFKVKALIPDGLEAEDSAEVTVTVHIARSIPSTRSGGQ